MVDVIDEDNLYWWVRLLGDLQIFDVFDVLVFIFNFYLIFYEYEYDKWMERVGVILEVVVDFDLNYKLLFLKDFVLEFMMVLRFGRILIWLDFWWDVILLFYFVWLNYKFCLGGLIICFICFKFLDILYVQELEGVFGNYDGEVVFEDVVIVEGCFYIMGVDCFQVWLKFKYLNDG